MASIQDCRFIELPRIRDVRGSLSFTEANKHIPFEFKRMFYLYDFPEGTSRGGHAHIECHQFLIAMIGAFEISVCDGKVKSLLKLDIPNEGLYIPPGIWVELTSTSDVSLLTVLASHVYFELDYIRNYKDYLKIFHG